MISLKCSAEWEETDKAWCPPRLAWNSLPTSLYGLKEFPLFKHLLGAIHLGVLSGLSSLFIFKAHTVRCTQFKASNSSTWFQASSSLSSGTEKGEVT